MNEIIKIVESLGKSCLLNDGATETVKIEPMASLWMQPVASSLINAISRKGQEVGFLPLLALALMMKVLGREVVRAGRECYNNMDKDF